MLRTHLVVTACLLLLTRGARAATDVEIPGGVIHVEFAGNVVPDRHRVIEWIDSSARAVANYYGRFPASSTRLVILPKTGRGVSGGRTWAHRGATIRVRIGDAASERDFAEDWVLVHEMTHLAFPSVPERHEWIEEGLATYVEPVARAQSGQLSAEEVWAGFIDGMPNGLPRPGDRGLDHTHTWGRTYWGGALFCLLADIEIRRRTGNRHGLQDALRAIMSQGNMETDSALPPLLAIGDRAVGVPVLQELYEQMKDEPESIDLDALWWRLGIERHDESVTLKDAAIEAEIRRAITTPAA